MTSQEVIRELDLPYSEVTFRTFLKVHGLRRYVAKRKSF